MEKLNELGLTYKQDLFCTYYVKLKNGTQAALQAGYSPNIASEIASENLRKDNVVERIKQLQKEIGQTTEQILSVEQRKARLSKFALQDSDNVDPIQAIKELNKMERIGVADASIVDNRQQTINISVSSPEARQLVSNLLSGQRAIEQKVEQAPEMLSQLEASDNKPTDEPTS